MNQKDLENYGSEVLPMCAACLSPNTLGENQCVVCKFNGFLPEKIIEGFTQEVLDMDFIEDTYYKGIINLAIKYCETNRMIIPEIYCRTNSNTHPEEILS